MSMIYSQTGLEEIILSNLLPDAPHVSCEIGAADGLWLSNTANLVRHLGWRGVFVEIDQAASLRCAENYSELPVTIINSRVTINNINDFVPKECGFLSIDVDGNDYWLWTALETRPAIVCIEYNHRKIGEDIADYDPDYVRTPEFYSYGASRESMLSLAKYKGYELLHDDGQCNLLFRAHQKRIFPMPELTIDVPRFEAAIPREFRETLAENVRATVRSHHDEMNHVFFGDLDRYHKRPIHPPQLRIPDLFSPNVCALDFALKHFNPGEDVILDWGCGLGLCGIHFSRLGYRVFGYDNWSQVPKAIADTFQDHYGHPMKFIESPVDCEPTVVIHVSIWMKDRPAWDRPCVQWILSDRHYVPGSFDGGVPDGFEEFGHYGHWLTVFRRKA
jgi:hypothetical protein